MSAPWGAARGFTSPKCNYPAAGWQLPGSRLAGGRYGAAGNQLHDAVLRRDGNHVGYVPPRAIEQAGRDIVFLVHGADLAAILAAHIPDDLDILLARLWFSDNDGSSKDEVCLGLRIGDNRDVLPSEDLGDGSRQGIGAVARGTVDAADQQPGFPARLGLCWGLVLQHCSEPGGTRCGGTGDGILRTFFPIAHRSLEPLGAFAEREARRLAQIPDRDERALALGCGRRRDLAAEVVAADARGFIACRNFQLL